MRTPSSSRTRAIALALVFVTLLRFSQFQSFEEKDPLQANILDTIHSWFFGSSSSAASSVAPKPVLNSAPKKTSSSIAPEPVPSSVPMSPYDIPEPTWMDTTTHFAAPSEETLNDTLNSIIVMPPQPSSRFTPVNRQELARLRQERLARQLQEQADQDAKNAARSSAAYSSFDDFLEDYSSETFVSETSSESSSRTTSISPSSSASSAIPAPLPLPISTTVGSDAKAIARWDVVPYQTFSTTMNVGVVAFHINGIQKVSFSVNGASPKDVTAMTLNPETNVVEYWIPLKASDYPDGQIEIRATVYPTIGIPRVLQGPVQNNTGTNTTTTNGEQSMWLFANAGGGLHEDLIYVKPSTGSDTNSGTQSSPVKTLIQAFTLAKLGNKDGARIILTEAGRYNPDRESMSSSLTFNNTRWVTVEPASNVTREQVEIVGTGEIDRLLPRVQKIHWKNLTFRTDTYAYMNEATATHEWYDHSLILSIAHDPEDWVHWRATIYATDSRAEGSAYGFIGAELVRNCVVKNTFDAYQRSQLVINSSIERQRQSAEAALHHPDFYQSWGEMRNVILYGITGDDIDGTQVIFINQPLAEGPNMTDAAFVNWNVKTYDSNGGPPWSQLQGPMNNVYFKNVNIPNQKMVFRTDGDPAALNHFEPTNVVFEGCRFNAYLPVQIPAGVTIK